MAGGIAAIVFGLSYAGWLAIELSRVPLGFDDGDDPEQSVAFLREHPDVYVYAGLVLVVMAIALTVAALAVAELAAAHVASLTVKAITAFGLFAAASFLVNGIVRLQIPGTLVYMDDLDHAFGLSAYVVVQIAGTQGLGSAGIFAASLWAIGLCLLRLRSGMFPLWLSVLGVVPALPWLAGLVGALSNANDSSEDGIGWFFCIGGILGAWVWYLALGVVLLFRKVAPAPA
jgi:hypothetical protein